MANRSTAAVRRELRSLRWTPACYLVGVGIGVGLLMLGVNYLIGLLAAMVVALALDHVCRPAPETNTGGDSDRHD